MTSSASTLSGRDYIRLVSRGARLADLADDVAFGLQDCGGGSEDVWQGVGSAACFLASALGAFRAGLVACPAVVPSSVPGVSWARRNDDAEVVPWGVVSGGFMGVGMTWEDYVGRAGAPRDVLERIRQAVVLDGVTFGGDVQQAYANVVVDGQVVPFTYRAWGDLLAAAWSDSQTGAKYDYMAFYMGAGT